MNKNSAEIPSRPWAEFFNQYNSFESKFIGGRACGPTALAMAINLIHQKDSVFQKVTPRDVLLKASHMTELPLNKKHFYLVAKNFKPNGLSDYIPIGDRVSKKDRALIALEPDLEIQEVVDDRRSEDWGYGPIYTTNNGLDHRGVGGLLETYEVGSDRLGDPKDKVNIHKVIRDIERGNFILASVTHSEDSSHLILVTEVNHQNGDWLLIYDPAANGPQWVSIAEFEQIFRGYGTLIYNPRKGTK